MRFSLCILETGMTSYLHAGHDFVCFFLNAKLPSLNGCSIRLALVSFARCLVEQCLIRVVDDTVMAIKGDLQI